MILFSSALFLKERPKASINYKEISDSDLEDND